MPYTQNAEVMEDLESRIAELFALEIGTDGRVVKLELVERVTRQLGMPDGAPESPEAGPAPAGRGRAEKQNPPEFRRERADALSGGRPL